MARLGRVRIDAMKDIGHWAYAVAFPPGTIIHRIGNFDALRNFDEREVSVPQVLVEHESLIDLTSCGPAIDCMPEYRVDQEFCDYYALGFPSPRFERVLSSNTGQRARERSVFADAKAEAITHYLECPTCLQKTLFQNAKGSICIFCRHLILFDPEEPKPTEAQKTWRDRPPQL
jgi:hypothetical protein